MLPPAPSPCGAWFVLLRAGALRDCGCTAVLVNHRTFFQLPTAQGALGHEVEVGRLALGAAVTRLDAACVDLGRAVGRQVVLHVDRALRTQRLLVDHFLLVGVANDVQLAVRHLLQPQRQFVERVLAIVVNTPRFLGVLLKRTLAPILDHDALLNRRHTDRGRATGALSDRVPAGAISRRRAGHGDGVARVRAAGCQCGARTIGDN